MVKDTELYITLLRYYLNDMKYISPWYKKLYFSRNNNYKTSDCKSNYTLLQLGVKCLLTIYPLHSGEIITSTLYAVLPLFATRFAACTGVIWVTFIEPYLIQSDIKLFLRDIYAIHLVRWNLLRCFPCFCNLEFPNIFFGDLLRFEQRTSMFSCLCMSMLTLNSGGNMQKHGYLGCFHAVSTKENISGVWGINRSLQMAWIFEEYFLQQRY